LSTMHITHKPNCWPTRGAAHESEVPFPVHSKPLHSHYRVYGMYNFPAVIWCKKSDDCFSDMSILCQDLPSCKHIHWLQGLHNSVRRFQNSMKSDHAAVQDALYKEWMFSMENLPSLPQHLYY